MSKRYEGVTLYAWGFDTIEGGNFVPSFGPWSGYVTETAAREAAYEFTSRWATVVTVVYIYQYNSLESLGEVIDAWEAPVQWQQ